ncbi:hypothetical protein OY671_007907, partial [Metschnikowia pulcherrima]
MEWSRFPEVTLAALHPWVGEEPFDPSSVEEVEEDAAYAPILRGRTRSCANCDGGTVAACPARYAGGGGPDRGDHPGRACQPAGPRAAARGMTITSEADAQAWSRDRSGVDAAGMARSTRSADSLVAENERQNSVARGTSAHVWQRHIVDSAQSLDVPRETLPAGPWLDSGTGAGFPGSVVAALQPERHVTSVDSRRSRTEWLDRAAAALDSANVEVISARVEDVPARIASVISARAFAPSDKSSLLSARFSTPDTLWSLPKGAKAKHELDLLPKSWRHMFHVEQSSTDPDAGVIAGRSLGGQPPV